MLTLNDGRTELWQWDTGRTLDVDADCSQVHFSNKVFGRSIDVDVANGVAIIPDILLQTDKDLNVWAFVGTTENGYTKISKTFKVNRRNKPSDYVSTPQEQITLKDATAILEEAKDVANKAIESAEQAEDTANKAVQITDEMKRLADQVGQNADTATHAKEDALNAQAKAEEVVESCIPDDTAVDGKPWTSKKIVDSLCMPFEESGNPVQVYPVENYPLGVKVSWEPAQEGSGDPSPDNIRPIKGRDSVKVERCGENLLNIKPFNKFTKNGITFEYVPDGGIHISGTATASADGPVFPVWHLPPGKYYGLNTVKGIHASFVVQRNGKPLWLNAKGIFEILAWDVTKYWYALVSAGETVDETIYPYFVPGTTAPTTYTPYTGSTTDIALPETVYGGTLDAVSGEGQETWKTIDLANAKISLYGINQYGIANFYLLTKTNNIHTTTGVTDYFTSSLPKDNTPFNNATKIGIMKANESTFYIRLKETDAKNPEMVKAYLASINAKLVYKLAEPVPFTATSTQPIPALIGVNTIYTDADGVVVTGAEDPKHTITELKNAIISLGGNI